MLKTLLVAGVVALMLPLSLVVGALAMNRLPLFDPPGLIPRLRHYLTTNLARTDENGAFPELLPRRFPLSPERARDTISGVARELGWEIAHHSGNAREIDAVATTRLWRFKDDIKISFQGVDDSTVVVNVSSRSRVGKGDLGTNSRRIMEFYAALSDAVH